MERPGSPAELVSALAAQRYLADRGLSTAMYLALSLGRPLLLEGEAGVGKTEVAKALASAFGLELIRLQCYEGIDAGQALYEWDYARQLLHIRALSDTGAADRGTADGGAPATTVARATEEVFGLRFLLERPLLAAVRAGDSALLLIDEIDRADDEFEAFLLEILSDFQVTIPEIGTIRAVSPPVVILTSNRTRDLHDALKRRCLYHWIDYPTPEREVQIVEARAPEVPAELARRVAQGVARLRALDLAKRPGVAETIDWARALRLLGGGSLDAESAQDTLGSVIKDHDDQVLVRAVLAEVVRDA